MVIWISFKSKVHSWQSQRSYTGSTVLGLSNPFQRQLGSHSARVQHSKPAAKPLGSCRSPTVFPDDLLPPRPKPDSLANPRSDLLFTSAVLRHFLSIFPTPTTTFFSNDQGQTPFIPLSCPRRPQLSTPEVLRVRQSGTSCY